jgi:hypothetical protein
MRLGRSAGIVLVVLVALAPLIPRASAAALPPLPVDVTCVYKGCWSTMEPAQAGPNYAEFYGVSCASTSFCVAVGRYDPNWSFDFHTLAEQWNGKRWSLMSVPSPGAANEFNELTGVSCTSPTFCMAVGRFGPNITHIIAARWDGSTWTLLPAPNPGGVDATSELGSISCASDSFCVAVGDYTCAGIECPPPVRGSVQPLVERWDGSSWSVMPLPYATGHAWLTSVSCTSSTFCMAVGEHQYAVLSTFGERWDGSSWIPVTTLNPGEALGYAFDAVTGVSCTSPLFCMAVGVFGSFDTNGFQTAAQQWNGTSWTLTATANPSPAPSGYRGMTGVSCVTSSFCVSSGLFGPSPTPLGPDPFETFAERWDGTRWSLMKTTNPGGSENDNGLWSISCPSSAACVAAGYTGHGTRQPLAELWTPPLISLPLLTK